MTAPVDLDQHLPAIGAGDQAAFAVWLASAELPLRASLRRFARACDTEAVLQETLLRVWQLAPTVVRDDKGNSLLRLAHRIANNLCIDETRRLRQVPLDDETFAHHPDNVIEPQTLPDPLLRQALAACREALPKKPAEALLARLLDGGASPDALLAKRIGATLNTFLQNITRARKLLAECLAKKRIAL